MLGKQGKEGVIYWIIIILGIVLAIYVFIGGSSWWDTETIIKKPFSKAISETYSFGQLRGMKIDASGSIVVSGTEKDSYERSR